jgi:hypothetical protein
MNYIETISNLLSSDQSILHFSINEERLDKYKNFKNYKIIGMSDQSDIQLDFNKDFNLEELKGFDTILFTSGLEIADDPIKLIEKIKNLSETVCIYEFKYEYIDNIDENWHCHWRDKGLTWSLQQHFDLINEMFLEQATFHTCKIPYTPKPDEIKENQDAIR